MSESDDPERRDPDRLAELKEQIDRLNGQVLNLTERVARLEEDNKWLKSQLKEIARRDWYILAGIGISILIGIFDLLLRLAVAH
jgi:predicted RNase H-like nuclease (RuvC/YqgF family)